MISRLSAFTFLLITAGCSSVEAEPESAESSETAYGTCPDASHECVTWGASCNGGQLETCVIDARGCRVKMVETCDLGCSAGACGTCRSVLEPKAGSSLAGETSWYRHSAKSGSHLYVAWDERNGRYSGPGYGLAVVDVTNPAAPFTSKVLPLAAGDYVTRLSVSGNRLYAIQKERVQIWSITNPIAPVALGSYAAAAAAPGSYPPIAIQRAVSVDGSTACVAADDGLHIVDVSNPAAPVRLGFLAAAFRPTDVVCKNGFAALASFDALHIVDLRVPGAPALAAAAKLGGHRYDYSYDDTLRFDGVRAYVASTAGPFERSSGLVESFDFTPSLPGAPSSSSTLAPVGALRGLPVLSGFEISGTDLFFRNSGAVGSVDLTEPKSPKLKKHVVVAEGVRGLARAGSHLLASSNLGITAIDLTNAPDVVLAPTNDWLGGIAMEGSIAYMASGKGGFVIADMRDPKTPIVLSKVAVHATSISLLGHRAYVTVADNGNAGGGDELRVYDVSSPWEPHLLGTHVEHRGYSHTRTMDDVVATGTRAYAICSGGQLCVFDATSLATPTLLAHTYLTQHAAYTNPGAFAANGNLVYLAKPDALTVADVTDPNNPVIKSTAALGGYAGAGAANVRVARSGNNVFVLYDCFDQSGPAGHRCLDVVDVSNPTAPAVIGHTTKSARLEGPDVYGWDHDSVGALGVFGDRLYLTTRGGGAIVFDVADPTHPKAMARLWTSAFAGAIFVRGRFATAHTGPAYNAAYDSGTRQVIEMCR